MVTPMLHNVYLDRHKTTPPVEHRGDFWYWKLTLYGLHLMRAVVRASYDGFSYTETIMEPEPDTRSQLVFLYQLNSAIHATIAGTPPLQWAAMLDSNPYLHDRQVIIDIPTFEREIDHLVARITGGYYDAFGHKIYYPAHA